MEHCQEHSGLEVKIDSLTKVVESGFERVNTKMDAVHADLNTSKLIDAVNEVESKWKFRMLAAGWGAGGGGGIFGVIKAISYFMGR